MKMPFPFRTRYLAGAVASVAPSEREELEVEHEHNGVIGKEKQ